MSEIKNKKFLAQHEKEERQKRIIMIGTIAVLAIVVGLVVYGLISENVFKPKAPVLELGSHSISTSEFKQRVRYQRLNMVNQAIQMYQYGMPQYVTQLANQLQPIMVAQSVMESLKSELVIMEEAEKLEIEITDEELEIEIQKLFGYFAEGTPTPAPTQEILPTSTLTEQQLALIPDTATPTVAPEETEEEEVEPSPTATQVEAEEAGEPDPTATPILQPTEYTYELYQENYKNTLNNLNLEISMEEETLLNMVVAYIYSERIMEVVTADVEGTQDNVWARHILVSDEETVQEVFGKLNEGGDFAELAKEYSTCPSSTSGGDLGWFSQDAMVEPFADAAFALEIGEVSEPVETSFGWHIIQVLGHEERTIDQATLDQMRQAAFEEWLNEKQTEYSGEFVISESWADDIPTTPDLPVELLQAVSQQQQEQLAPDIP